MLSRPWPVLLPVSVVIVSLISLGGCPAHPNRAEKAPAGAVPAGGAAQSEGPLLEGQRPQVPGPIPAPGHQGRPYEVDSGQSLLTILAIRGGALAKAGHNHVIASRDLAGTVYVPADALRTSFEIHMPVAQLTVDEPELRAKEGPEFPTEVPQAAKGGTRHNMLSEALLDGERYPDIKLVGDGAEGAAAGVGALASGLAARQGASAPNLAAGKAALVSVQVSVKDQVHTLRVPISYVFDGGALIVTGEMPVRQSELGLTPFSALLGALQVQDEMRVRFRLVAHEAPTQGSH